MILANEVRISIWDQTNNQKLCYDFNKSIKIILRLISKLLFTIIFCANRKYILVYFVSLNSFNGWCNILRTAIVVLTIKQE